MLFTHNLVFPNCWRLLCAVLALPLLAFAGGRSAEIRPLLDNDEAGLEQTLQYNFSPEDRVRLRKALDEYARSSDPEHAQIEQRRRAMQESVEERFNECNHDNDDSLDREEATQCLPQVARHFNFVDIDEDGVITLEELQLAQAKNEERRKAAEAKIEAEHIQAIEAEIKTKAKVKSNKQAINGRKRPG